MGKTNNYKNKNKSNKKFSKDKDYGKDRRGRSGRENDPDISVASSSYGGNDVSWYTRNAAMVESAAKIPYPYQPGREIPLKHIYSCAPAFEYNGILNDAGFAYDYPGIMSLRFDPTVGVSETISSPINIAARDIYGRIRSKYSGSLEADAPDIMMYLIALDSVYMLIEDMKRAYYTVNLYSPDNTLYPVAAMNALGWDFNECLHNKTQMFQYIVELTAKASRFRVPNNMDLYKRHQFMCSNIYSDAPIPKSQQYVFRPGGYYELKGESGPTSLKYHRIAELHTPSGMYMIINDLLDTLMAWDTSYTIVGYLERAYEGEEFIQPAPCVYDAILTPVYNPEILIQIQNATIIPIDYMSLDCVQDVSTNAILCRPAARKDVVENGVLGQMLLSMPTSGTPSVVENVIGTRLSTVISGELDDYDQWKLSCGTEIITEMTLFTNNTIALRDGFDSNVIIIPGPGASATSFNTYKSVLRLLQTLSSFAWHPTVYCIYSNSASDYLSASNAKLYIYCDAANVTKVDAETLANLHRMCVYSEFNCYD